MVKVASSAGGFIQIEMLGINEVMRRLLRDGNNIKQGADFGIVRAGEFIEEEVKESIAGHRAERKSVRTGLFGNSIQFIKTGEAEGLVHSNPTKYPGTQTTTADVAKFMEKQRNHFRNTEERNKGKIRDIINTEIKQTIN